MDGGFASRVSFEFLPPFPPGSCSDTDRFGTGDKMKRPRASPAGTSTGCLDKAGMALNDTRSLSPAAEDGMEACGVLSDFSAI